MRRWLSLLVPFACAIAPALFAASIMSPAGSAKASEATGSRQRTAQRQSARLGAAFQTAALRALHFTLSEVGDGSTFVWHHKSGRLRGAFKPTTSYQTSDGKVCRHIIIILSAHHHAGKTEGIACRTKHGRWELES